MAGEKPIAENRKARHDYHFLERLEAGIVLTGSEVKSLREGRVSLQQSYADVRDGEAWLVGAHIDTYEQAGIQNHEPERDRKLLRRRGRGPAPALDRNDAGVRPALQRPRRDAGTAGCFLEGDAFVGHGYRIAGRGRFLLSGPGQRATGSRCPVARGLTGPQRRPLALASRIVAGCPSRQRAGGSRSALGLLPCS